MAIFGWNKNRTSSARLRREGRGGRSWRHRQANKKILVPRGTQQPLQPAAPTHTHHDTATIANAHAVMTTIAALGEEEALGVHVQLNEDQADEAAAEDELGQLNGERGKQVERRDEYVEKARKIGLGHKLVRQPLLTVAVAVTVGLAIMFETLSMSSPMALLGVLDFGVGAHTQERLGAIFAALLALGYASVLAVVSKRAGAELKARHYRLLIEADQTDGEGAEGRPRTVHAVFADWMVGVALIGGGLALYAASIVRETAVGILAGAGQNTVHVSWWVFLALTLGIFVGLVAVGYWAANPIAKVLAEMEAGISNLGEQIDAKRRECYKLAARVDAHQKQLQMIDARSRHEQLVQLHLALEEIARRAAANPHIYNTVVDPSHVQDVISDPSRHVRDLTLPSLKDKLTPRINTIRSATASRS